MVVFYYRAVFQRIGLVSENPREEEHGKDDDLAEEEEGEAVPLGVQPDLDVRLKFKSCWSTTTSTGVFALLVETGTVVQMPVVLCCIVDTICLKVSTLRPIPQMVVAFKVAIANVIMSSQPVSWICLLAMFMKVLFLPSRFWHCHRNWYSDSVDFIFHQSYFTCVPVEVFQSWSRWVMMWTRIVEGDGILRKVSRGR